MFESPLNESGRSVPHQDPSLAGEVDIRLGAGSVVAEIYVSRGLRKASLAIGAEENGPRGVLLLCLGLLHHVPRILGLPKVRARKLGRC